MIDPVAIELEITSKCTLYCPECARTKDPDEKDHRWKYGEVDISAIEKILTVPTVERVVLSGAYGDPIYHTKFHDIITLIKKHNKKITINTNGSYRSKEWWEQLAPRFTSEDIFVFSVDGLPGNDLYRVNSDWPSIETGIKTMIAKSSAQLWWKWIIFKYNENDVIEGYKLSKQLGIKNFEIVNSGRQYPSGMEPSRSLDDIISELKEYQQR